MQKVNNKKARTKIAFVINTLMPGGAERLAVEMSLALRQDHDVIVFCLDLLGEWAYVLRNVGIPVYCIWRQPGLDLSVPVKLAKNFYRHNIDIIHAHQYAPWFYAALSRVLYPTPRLLFEEHGRHYPERKIVKRMLANRIFTQRLTHRCVAVSKDVRNRLELYEGLNKRSIEVIYNGVKPESMPSAERTLSLRGELGLAPDDFIVGTVGRFDPIKNLPFFIDSIDHGRKKGLPLKGLMVGDGPVLSEIKARVQRLGLSGNVLITGFRNNTLELLKCMDLFVLSSFSEGTSMALLEAMAAGIPAAVTDVGGNPEIVIKNETGWVVPSNQIEGLVSVFFDAFNDSAKRARFAHAGKLRFEERFRFDKMIESYRRIYREMMASGK